MAMFPSLHRFLTQFLRLTAIVLATFFATARAADTQPGAKPESGDGGKGMGAREWGQGNECQNLAGRITLTHRVTRPEFVTSASLFRCPHSSAIHFRF